MSTREETLEIMRQHKAELTTRYGLTSLGIFGSVARGDGTEKSDIDVVVRLREPNLFTLVHVKEDLEGVLQKKVDLVHYREQMNGYLKRCIDDEAVYV